jgi:hypothetical protein
VEQPGPLPTGGFLDLLLFRRPIVRDLAERLLESFFVFVFVTAELASGFNKAIKLRFPSDLTEDEWKLVDPLIRPDKRGGGKR